MVIFSVAFLEHTNYGERMHIIDLSIRERYFDFFSRIFVVIPGFAGSLLGFSAGRVGKSIDERDGIVFSQKPQALPGGPHGSLCLVLSLTLTSQWLLSDSDSEQRSESLTGPLQGLWFLRGLCHTSSREL